MKILWASLAVVVCFLSCTPKEPQVVSTPDYTKGNMAVYEKFADFEPNLYRNNDTTYVVNFWATWCKPCVAELPYFERLHKAYKDKPLKVILVSLDDAAKLDEKILPFVEERNLKSELILLNDPFQNEWIDKVNPNWSGAIPATIIYKKDKRMFYEQSFVYEELVKTLAPFQL